MACPVTHRINHVPSYNLLLAASAASAALHCTGNLISANDHVTKQFTPRDQPRAIHDGEVVWEAVEQGKNIALSVNILVTLVYLLIF